MCTKRDLKNILEEISPSAKFTRFDYASPEKFRIELRCQVEKDQTMEFYVEFAKNWIKKFSKSTATGWIVRSSFLKLKRLVFRKIYTCHRASFNKTKKVDSKTRNQECNAKIDFKIKHITRNTIKNDKLLKEGLNLNIIINFVHSHEVWTAESYHLLRNVSETEEVFQKYFEMGCIPNAIRYYHELTLIDKYGENCLSKLSPLENTMMNPPVRTLFYLQEKMKKKKCLRSISTREVMEEKRKILKESEVDIVSPDNDTNTYLIVTPLMKRVIAEIGLDHVFIDSTDIPNTSSVVTFIFVPISIGAVPVACVLHGKYDLNNALQVTKSHIETLTGHQFYPKVQMLDNFEHKEMLPSVKSFASRYSLCSEIWSWLNNDDNKIERKIRHSMMLTIRTLLYADSLETAEKIYSELKRDENVASNEKVKDYLALLWEKKEQWMFIEDPYSNNNLIDLSIRFLKELITRNCKSFNEPLMVELVTNILENHFRRILASYVKKKKNASVATYTKFLSKATTVLNFGSEVRRISTNEFRIEKDNKSKKEKADTVVCKCEKSKKYINFRTDTMMCNCGQGKKGHFCEHLSAIINVIDCEMMKSPILTEEEINIYIGITDGEVDDEIKPEINEDVKFCTNFDDDIEKSHDFNEEYDIANDEEVQSGASSTKAEDNDANDDDFFVEIKTEKLDGFDPLDESIEQEQEETIQSDFVTAQSISAEIPTTSKASNIKESYETVLKAVNDEFRRLNRFFSENPNNSNLETMKHLARELSKIRPVEKVNFENMTLKPNRKRKRDS